MLEGLAVPGLSQCQHRVSLPLAALMGPQEMGDLMLSQAKSDCGKRSIWDSANLPLPCHSSHCTPSPHCYVDAIVIAICILKDYYMNFVWLV